MKQKVLILIIMLFFIISLYFIINRNSLTLIEKIIKEPILYIENISSKPIDLIKSVFIRQSELDKLNSKVLKYQTMDKLLKEKDNQIKELESMLEIKTNMSNYDIINATIISRSVTEFYQTMTIDKGLNDKINIGDAVMTNKGLVGIVNKVTNNTSVIKLLTSIDGVAVNIKSGDDSIFGILTPYKNRYFKITNIAYDKKIKKGSLVFTSGIDNNLESGLLIGEVISVKKSKYDLEQIATIKAFTNFDNLKYVAIIKRKK